jgi:toxin ParE1/3/4
MSQEPLAIHPEAEQEYRDAYSWYRERSIPAAERFKSTVERALHQIQQSPDRWPSSHSHFRRYTLYEFPYSIYDAMRRGRSCWRLGMGVEGRGIGGIGYKYFAAPPTSRKGREKWGSRDVGHPSGFAGQLTAAVRVLG